MAYDRVNWEDKPSTATPINAENLNKMDKGIKDIEEGKVSKADLVQTDQVNNPEKVPSSAVTHALGQEIDTLNNNLAYQEEVVESMNFTNVSVFKRGGVGSLRVVRTAVDMVAETTYTIGVIPAGYRPQFLYNKMVLCTPSSVPCYLNINPTSGVATLYPHSDIPSGTSLYLVELYILQI